VKNRNPETKIKNGMLQAHWLFFLSRQSGGMYEDPVFEQRAG
jgi:hypothetical protein